MKKILLPEGVLLIQEATFIFFGNRRARLETLKKRFPLFTFHELRQTHSTTVLEASALTLASNPDKPQADAHYTQEPDTALCIKTADCIPIFINAAGVYAAIHAGWRGVATKILEATTRKIISHITVSNSAMEIWIGPHIAWDSFEVDLAVANQILQSINYQCIEDKASSPYSYILQKRPPHGSLSVSDIATDDFIQNVSKEIIKSSTQQKLLLNLKKIIETQMGEIQKTIYHSGPMILQDHSVDTLTHPEFESFRRDREKAGRQLSFICRSSKSDLASVVAP